MKTVIHDKEKDVLELYDEIEDSREEGKTITQKSCASLQKNFRVVDLWKIRSMKKYFNYQ